MILRSTIVKLLQHRIGLFTADANGDIPPAKSHIPTTQQVLLVMSALLCVSLLQWQVLETLEVLPQQVLETLEVLPQQVLDALGVVSKHCLGQRQLFMQLLVTCVWTLILCITKHSVTPFIYCRSS